MERAGFLVIRITTYFLYLRKMRLWHTGFTTPVLGLLTSLVSPNLIGNNFTNRGVALASDPNRRPFPRNWGSDGKDAVMQCFYMGSMRTNNGIGKCKSNHGKEYDVQF